MSAIQSLGSFSSLGIFGSESSPSRPIAFRRYNFIYGFNGSGKTTLSRIFRSLEKGKADKSLANDTAVEIRASDESIFLLTSETTDRCDWIAVYNSDYVEENLAWIEGESNPIFYLGKENVLAAESLTEVVAQLKALSSKLDAIRADEKDSDRMLTAFKRERARHIAEALNLGRRYDASHLTKDYEKFSVALADRLSLPELSAQSELYRSIASGEPISRISVPLLGDETLSTVLAIRGIDPASIAITGLQKHRELADWLRVGANYHSKNRLTQCVFCQNMISIPRLRQLEELVRQSFDDFYDQCRSIAATADRLGVQLEEITLPPAEKLFSSFRERYRPISAELIRAIQTVRGELSALHHLLGNAQMVWPARSKIDNIIDNISSSQSAVQNICRFLNDIIDEHNQMCGDKARVAEAARYRVIMHFLLEAYDEYNRHSKRQSLLSNERGELEEEIASLRICEERFRAALKTHAPAAEVMNSLIRSYLGHGELQLKASQNGYILTRNGRKANSPPSDGEKTAISLCYFIASLTSNGRSLSERVVFIDDPVSSLDTQCLQFSCLLIHSKLSSAKQIFVASHNSGCLQEFKKHWTRRRTIEETDIHQFLFIKTKIDANEKRSSAIVAMPKLLRTYHSEYHYMFSVIIACIEGGETANEQTYLIPNLIRRVLEIFLGFRVPGTAPLQDRIKIMIDSRPGLQQERYLALDRLVQTESHSNDLDDIIRFGENTIQRAYDACVELIDFMDSIDPDHTRAMRKLCRVT